MLQYLLKWKGYSQVHNSWEPAEHVHAPELVEEYHNKNPLAIQSLSSWPTESSISDTSRAPSPTTYLAEPLIHYVSKEEYEDIKEQPGAVVWGRSGLAPPQVFFKDQIYI